MGLKTIEEESEQYAIYEETNRDSNKDTSLMLQSGASRVYFATVFDDRLLIVFNRIMDLIPEGTPIVCESPALRNFIEPGIFIIMNSLSSNKLKNINHLLELPHVMFKLEEVKLMSNIPISFENGKWKSIK